MESKTILRQLYSPQNMASWKLFKPVQCLSHECIWNFWFYDEEIVVWINRNDYKHLFTTVFASMLDLFNEWLSDFLMISQEFCSCHPQMQNLSVNPFVSASTHSTMAVWLGVPPPSVTIYEAGKLACTVTNYF